LGGKWSTFVGNIQKSAIEIGEALAPTLKIIIDQISALTEWIRRNATVIGWALTYFGTFATVVYLVAKAIKIAAAAQAFWQAIMMANPIVLIIGAIAALIAAIIYAWYKFDGFRGAVFGLWEAFKQVFVGIKDLVKGTMGGVAELILGALTFDITKIQSGLKKLGASFSAYGSGVAAAYKAGSDAGKAFQPKVPEFLKKVTGGAAGETATALNADLADGSVQNGINGITSGGSKQTNITVNLGKLQDQIVIHAQGIQEGVEQMEAMVTEALLKVLNSANKLATQ
jgi:hypothetical protein